VEDKKPDETEYSLPYPGMLPDHPLYFVKMARDRIQLWMSRDPLTKYKLLLNNADKRMAAALALAEKGKTGLAVTTAIKSEYYFQRAVGELENLALNGDDTGDLYQRILDANDKHAMVLVGIFSRLPEESKSSLNEAMKVNVVQRERIMTRLGGEKEEEKVLIGTEEEKTEEEKAETEEEKISEDEENGEEEKD
jgi:hypothetical protein